MSAWVQILIAHVKCGMLCHTSVTPVPSCGGWRPVDPWSSSVSQLRQISEPWFQWQICLKKKGGEYLRKIPLISLWPLHEHTHVHTPTNIYKHHTRENFFTTLNMRRNTFNIFKMKEENTWRHFRTNSKAFFPFLYNSLILYWMSLIEIS